MRIQIKEKLFFRFSDTGVGIEPESLQEFLKDFTKLIEHDQVVALDWACQLPNISSNHMVVRIWVESEFGKGSSFFFTLPAGN